MNIDHQRFESACFEMVRTMRYENTPLDMAIAKSMVRGYVEIALREAELLAEQEIDPNIVIRAINYLAQAHAIPPLEGNMAWFQSSLGVLLELANPTTEFDSDHGRFFQELTQGISEARGEY